ncbi:MAG: peptide ABC transporter substrate-binding protein [Gemmatimonadota bacterium]
MSLIRLAAVLLAVSCTSRPVPDDTVVMASGADLESANPLTTIHPLARQVQRHALFVTLTRYDSVLGPAPYFARSWVWSHDRRSLELTLAGDLRWHDGTPTTAGDVVFTINAARDPGTGFFRRADLASIDSVSSSGKLAITIHFADPQARFPLVLCELPIAPAHLLARYSPGELRSAPFSFAPTGNGPFRFVSRSPGRHWVFGRNADFPASLGGPPALERFVVAVVDEATTKFAGLVSGDLHVAGISPTMAGITARDPLLRVLDYPVAFTYAMVFNTSRPPFDDPRIRRAISAAIRRERLVGVALAGYATPAVSAVPAEHPWATPGPAGPGIDAGAALDSAGWPKGNDGKRRRAGVELRLTIRTVGSGDNSLEQLLQADLRDLGVAADIQQMELASFLADARASEKRFDALVTGIPGDISLSHIEAMFSSAQSGGALDYAGFHDRELDRLFLAARKSAGDESARTTWRSIDSLLADKAPVAWLYHARGIQGLRREIDGVTMDLRGELVSLVRWRLNRERGQRNGGSQRGTLP